MTPAPEADSDAVSAPVPGATSARPKTPTVLTRRADFLRASRGLRHAAPGFHLQARRRGAQEPEGELRVGYTCSKKVGNAVARNRAKRRLRELARIVLPAHGQNGWDYVLVGRHDVTATHDFARMQRDLVAALDRVHRL